MKNTVYILLGTNLGDRFANIQFAINHLKEHSSVLQNQSSVYTTSAWGNTDQPDFLNQVLQITTDLDPSDLLERVLQIEKLAGRVRNDKWGPRILDIDILFYNSAIYANQELHIPHPQLHLRRFTLLPLVEIASELIHPVFNKTMSQLLNECPDKNQAFIADTSASL